MTPLKTFYHPDHIYHDPDSLNTPDQPSGGAFSEVAQRALIIHAVLQRASLGPIFPPVDFQMGPIEAVHTPDLLRLLQTAYQTHAAQTGRAEPLMPDTFALGRFSVQMPRSIPGQLGAYCFGIYTPIFERTWEAAYWSTQVALTAAAQVTAGDRLAYALCRPPGHHAAADMFGGFCYLNNVAIAADWLARSGRRVAIVDVDYHHGNGTQAIFYDRADVLFCSLHADPHDEYPYYWGYADETGTGSGEGANYNYPLPFGTDEETYLAALDDALTEVRHFSPDILLISLGLDTFVSDPVVTPGGGFKLQTDSYARIGQRFATLNLPTVVIQEGGYYLEALGANVISFFKGILN